MFHPQYYHPKPVRLPPCDIRTPEDHPHPIFTYVPTILHHMLFELFKNSIRATVESRGFGDEVEYPKIRVVVVGGKEDMIIKVSDEGRGVSRLELEKMNSYSELGGASWALSLWESLLTFLAPLIRSVHDRAQPEPHTGPRPRAFGRCRPRTSL